ncbi:unnamed protein product [Diabrotica balteata]|uniref:Platelet-derived growth factor (PDGF) family profile domain-containing protein n=1 Tax=Diabrotica balteata TaxID=107213 RepID=A0A9N9TFB0_DIABA|nr:unnamed protein product [Diabrotica balteata]
MSLGCKMIVVAFVVLFFCDGKEFKELNEELDDHSNYIDKFPCDKPQPRTFYLKDIVSKDDWNKKYKKQIPKIRPLYTILHRCEGSGGCSKYGEKCIVNETKIVKLAYNMGLSRRIELFEVKNHTSCKCDDSTNDSRIK